MDDKLVTEFNNEIADYQKDQNELRRLPLKGILNQDKPVLKMEDGYPLSAYEVANYDLASLDNSIAAFDDKLRDDKATRSAEQTAVLEHYLKSNKNFKNQIVKYREEHPQEVKNNQEFRQTLVNVTSSTWDKASSISIKERQIYDALYRQKQRENSGPNPCKDFVL